MNNKILIVEDDAFLRDGLGELLTDEGYISETAKNTKEAKQKVKEKPDLVVLDIMLPDGSGFTLCREMRGKGYNMPVLFLTARDDEIDIVRGLDAGADDYVTKPFKTQELMSRIRALLRRSSRSNNTLFKVNSDLTIDTNTMTVKKGGENVYLTKTEFQILLILVKNGGAIVTRNSLLNSIWDNAGNFIDDNTLSVHISRLRDKIGESHIKTVRGIGYRWEA